jgi:hypothetical protein
LRSCHYDADHAPVHFAKTYPVRRQALRKQITTLQAIILLTAVLFFLSFASGSELAEQKTGKKRWEINMTMGIASAGG